MHSPLPGREFRAGNKKRSLFFIGFKSLRGVNISQLLSIPLRIFQKRHGEVSYYGQILVDAIT
ncbi:hypothetical protein EGK65_01220 [Citrobacter farmeri]|nr:hypothetical protein EGK65_01220 [Citrobacter farmeri]